MLHYAYPTLDIYLEHMSRYSSEIARLLYRDGHVSGSWFAFAWNGVLNPVATFLYNYVVRLGFLDGREGLILHFNHSVYVHWKFVKAWWLARNGSLPSGGKRITRSITRNIRASTLRRVMT